MTIVAGDVLRVSMNFTLPDGTQLQNVYHYQRTGIAIITDAVHVSTLESKLNNAYAELAAFTADSVTNALSFVDLVEFVGGVWAVVENIGFFTSDFTPTEAVTDALPNQVSPYVLFKTDRPKSVGRKFLFPMTEANMVGSFLSAALQDAIVAYAVIAIDDVTLEALNSLVPGIIRTAVDTFLPYQVAIVNTVVGSQRRRRPGVGA